MAGLGRKEWSPGDTLTASDVNGYLMDQAVMVFAGTAARASAIPTPSAGMVAYSTATSLQVYNGTAWVDLSTGYGVATGGSSSSITVGGTAYTLLTFTSSGTLTVTKSGLFDVFAIGGGGGGGFYGTNNDGRGGGGGAGGGTGLVTAYFTANQTVTVGGKGLNQANGSPSRCGTVLACFGGASSGDTRGYVAMAGGSGGGGMSTGGGAGSAPQGFAGGSGTFGGGLGAGGGGGGYSAVGVNSSTGTGGSGGAGLDISTFIGGSSTFVMGGGGGGGFYAAGAGGSGVGGVGAWTGAGGNSTASAYGSGGGGGQTAGGTGSDGVVYVRFRA
jgi:hypothetical protein